ncbi:MAG: type VI secretion system membrane subunit TssM [Acidobacteria bacterium]|nr:type VI secretion system membrane subunit TssM [Acidobacteriota bacterium]
MLKRFSPFARTFIFGGILVLIAVLLVWFLAPRFGLTRFAIILVIAALLLLWLIILAIQYLVGKARASRSTVSADSRHNSEQSSSESEDTAVFGERLDRALRWLKKSKLAESGRDVVYDLPWYLLIGARDSGKSTLVVQSGFNFPYTDPKKTAGKLDFGPTTNCDLWVANEALFIDPSGNYFSEDREITPCLNMLRQLKQRRQQKPIDGIVLLVDTSRLFSPDDTAVRDQANKLRTFLDMTMQEFGMVIPIYLLFNKSDLIEGFQEFFSKPGEREKQLLGATFTREQYESQHPEKIFQQEFDQICRSARSFGIARLITESRRDREKTFPFPKQLSLMKDRLTEFVGILFQHSQFREKPLFRGFYFTSGVQGERSFNLVADLLKSKTGLPGASEIESTRRTNSYFIKTLLTQVILPDRNLAGLSEAARRRRRLKRMILAGTAGILLPIIILLCFWGAYRDNRRLTDAVESAREIQIENGKNSENLLKLGELRQRLEILDCTGKLDSCRISGRRFHWGLHVGKAALAEARRVYVEKLNQLFLDQLLNGDKALGDTYAGLKTQLRVIAGSPANDRDSDSDADAFDPGRAYTLLKTVMMLSDETKASPAFLEEQLIEYWSSGVQEKDMPEAKLLLQFYLHQLGDHKNPAYRLPTSLADKEIAKRVRDMLLVVDPDHYYYGIIQEEGSHKINRINLTGIVGVENTDLFDLGMEIDGTYTKVGWEQLVRGRIGEMKADYETERSWVLGMTASAPGQPRIEEKLEDRYFRDYGESWWNFLKSIDIVPFNEFNDASKKLVILSDNNQSPIVHFTKTAALNTWGDIDEPDPRNIKNIENTLEREPEAKARLIEAFQPLHEFVREKEGQDSPLHQYLKTLSSLQVVIKSFLDAGQPATQIQEIGKESENALRVTNGLLVSFDALSRESVEPLLKQPIQHVLKLVDRATPVGKTQERQRTLRVSGIVRDKDKTKNGVIVTLLEAYEDNDYKADKEIMRAQTKEGAFRFPSPINPGKYKICASEDKESYYCSDVRLARDNDGKEYELKRSRSRLIFGGGKRQLELTIK